MSEPDATQVPVGPALIYVAPLVSQLPALAAHGKFPVTWPAAWRAVGYTDAGVDMTYTPTVVEINVDENTALTCWVPSCISIPRSNAFSSTQVFPRTSADSRMPVFVAEFR